MLQPRTIEVIKSTVPMLEMHVRPITKCFYERLFTEHPQLRNLFNDANQKTGRQPAALANTVYKAAQHIDRLEALLPAVKQIAHKHRGLGVQPAHYPVVGQHLLGAIKEVLGEVATQEVLDAWAEAFQAIAHVFISVEQELYQQAQEQPGGWAGFRSFRVVRKQPESERITSFYLQPEDGQPLAAFEPGQYLTLKLSLPGEQYTHMRHYSLSDAPGTGYYRISVKREDDRSKLEGKASTWLHRHVGEGDMLLVSAPAGEFTLDRKSDRPVVLLSGGVGLTPLVSMLNTLVREQPARPVTFIHSAVNGRAHAMARHVAEVARAHSQVKSYVIYSQPEEQDLVQGAFHKVGHIDLQWLRSVLTTAEADFYFCGPKGFMRTVREALLDWGAQPERLHYEIFGPDRAA
jgi:nitric oxide dioxygenase